MTIPTVDDQIGLDVHSPKIRTLYEQRDWPALVRYYFAHQHKPALRVAARILHDPSSEPGDREVNKVMVSLQFSTYLINPTGFLIMPQEKIRGDWSESERLTLELFQLLPKISLCEQMLEHPVKKQAAMASVGIKAAIEGIRIGTKLEDLPAVGMLESMVGSTYARLRQLEPAREHFEKAIAIRRTLIAGEPRIYAADLALTLMNFAQVLVETAEIEAARRTTEESVSLYREAVKDDSTLHSICLGRALANLGTLEERLGERLFAINHLQEALNIFRNLPDKSQWQSILDLATCLGNLSTVEMNVGHLTRAREYLEEGIELLSAHSEVAPELITPLLAMMRSNLSVIDQRAGKDAIAQFQRAVESYRSLASSQPVVYLPLLAVALSNLGSAQATAGELNAAKNNLLEAKTIFENDVLDRPFANLDERIKCHITLGRLYLDHLEEEGFPDPHAARKVLRHGRELADKLRGRFLGMSQRSRIQSVMIELYDLSLQSNLSVWRLDESDNSPLKEAIEVAETARARNLIDLLGNEMRLPRYAPAELIRRLRTARGKLFEAEQTFYDAYVSETNNASDPAFSERAHHEFSARQHDEHQVINALRSEYEALIEEVHANYDSEFNPDLVVSPIDFDGIQELLSANPSTAIVQYSVGRDKSVAIIVTERELVVVPLPDLDVNRAYTLAFNWLEGYSKRSSHYADRLQRIKGSGQSTMNKTGLRLLEGLKKIVESGVFDQFGKDNPPGYFDKDHARQHEDAEQWYIENIRTGIEHGKLDTMISAWSDILPHLLQPVAECVIHPILKTLRENKIQRVILSLHRGIQVFPLHACRLDKVPYIDNLEALAFHKHLFSKTENWDHYRCFSDEFEVLYAPSLSVVRLCAARNREQNSHVLSIDNPTNNLPFSEVEGELCRSHFESSTHLALGAATKEAIIENCKTAEVIHYCGHASFNFEDPLESSLALEDPRAPEKWLSMREIYGTINADSSLMTILSGCESGSLLPDRGDEYISLASAFIFAGSRCVVSTLWETDDLASALLVDRFLLEWKREPRAARAMAKAQHWMRCNITSGVQLKTEIIPDVVERLSTDELREMCRIKAEYFAEKYPDSPPFESPAYWGAFIITGWDSPLQLETPTDPAPTHPVPVARSESIPDTILTENRKSEIELEQRLRDLGPGGPSEDAEGILDRLTGHQRRRQLDLLRVFLESGELIDQLRSVRERVVSSDSLLAEVLAKFDAGLAAMENSKYSEAYEAMTEARVKARDSESNTLFGLCSAALGHMEIAKADHTTALETYADSLRDCIPALRKTLQDGLLRTANAISADCFERICDVMDGLHDKNAFRSLNLKLSKTAALPSLEASEVFNVLWQTATEENNAKHQVLIALARCHHALNTEPSEVERFLGQAESASMDIDAEERLVWTNLIKPMKTIWTLESIKTDEPTVFHRKGKEELTRGRFNVALEYFDVAASLSKENGPDRQVSLNLVGAARALLELARPSEALQRLEKALQLLNKDDDPEMRDGIEKMMEEARSEEFETPAVRFRGRAERHMSNENYTEALGLIHRAIEEARTESDTDELDICTFGKLFISMKLVLPLVADEAIQELSGRTVNRDIRKKVDELKRVNDPVAERIRNANARMAPILSSAIDDEARAKAFMFEATQIADNDPLIAYHFAYEVSAISARKGWKSLEGVAAYLKAVSGSILGLSVDARNFAFRALDIATSERDDELRDNVLEFLKTLNDNVSRRK